MGEGRRSRWGLGFVALLTLLGVALERAGILDWHAGVAFGQGYADRWWLPPALALVTAVLYAASLPGSVMVWVAGILLPPSLAAPAFVTGGVVGALGAYTLARIAGRSAERKAGDSRLLRLLGRRSDFATLLAVRVAPSFPHSAINIAAGLLGVPRGRFLVSTALGLAIKGTVYVTAIHQAVGVTTMEQAISWRTIAPLAALTALLLLGPPLVRQLRGRRKPATRFLSSRPEPSVVSDTQAAEPGNLGDVICRAAVSRLALCHAAFGAFACGGSVLPHERPLGEPPVGRLRSVTLPACPGGASLCAHHRPCRVRRPGHCYRLGRGRG